MAPTPPPPESDPNETVTVRLRSLYEDATAKGFDPEKAATFVTELFVQRAKEYARSIKKRGPNFTPKRKKRRK